MSQIPLLPDDPKLTAYALGELDADERAAVEAALRENPSARAAVEEIRGTAAQLTAALAAEPAAETKPVAMAPGRHAERAPEGAPLPHRDRKQLKFPQLYYIIGLAAAACFAVVVTLREPSHASRAKLTSKITLAKHYTEIHFPPKEAQETAAISPMPDPLSAAPEATSMVAAELKPQVLQEEASVAAAKKDLTLLGQTKNAGDIRDLQDAIKLNATWAAAENRAATRIKTERERKQPALTLTALQTFAPIEQVTHSTESYTYQRDSDFLAAAQNPFSTFSIDVDTASYANVRRFLQGGRLPPVDAVRIEELVNYFPYRYAAPVAAMSGQRGEGAPSTLPDTPPFAATLEVASAPWAPTHRLVRIGLKGREASTEARPAANLVFLLDVSGSMNQPNRLPLVKESMRLLLGKLRADDRVAIVTYAGHSGLALPSTPAAKSREILAALDALSSGGSTNGAMGIQLAYDIAKANFVSGGLNRVILCTDGDFNVGVTSEGELTRLIEEKAKSGVFLTVLGFGMGNLNDSTLEKLADKGNGNYGYIDTRREAEKLLAEQVNGTLLTIAKDVKLQVDFNPAKVSSYRLIGYENRMLRKEDFNNDQVDAGEIGAGHTVTALYEIVPVTAADPTQPLLPAVDESKYAGAFATENRQWRAVGAGEGNNELLTLKVRYKEPSGDVSQRLDFPLVDTGTHFADASVDFKFAAAVAGFGMILRDSPHKGMATLGDVIAWAGPGINDDPGGHRSEFITLVNLARSLLR